MSVINEKTGISIGLMISALGGIYWLTTIHLQSVSSADEIKQVKTEIKEMREMQTDVKIIKSDLKRVLRKIGEE